MTKGLDPINNFYERTIFRFECDGGQVGLDFYPPRAKWSRLSADWRGRPIVIIVCGMSGVSLAPAICRMCEQFWDQYRIRTLVANRRGFAGVEITGNYPLSWIRWEDMDEIIDYLALDREDTIGSRIFLYGHSLGGAFVHLYNGVKGKSGALNRLDGAISVSAPYEMVDTVKKLSKVKIIDYTLVSGLKRKMTEYRRHPTVLRCMKEKGITEGKQNLQKTKNLMLFEFNLIQMSSTLRRPSSSLTTSSPASTMAAETERSIMRPSAQTEGFSTSGSPLCASAAWTTW